MKSPFSLDNDSSYQAWRSRKLENTQQLLKKENKKQLFIDIKDANHVTTSEMNLILSRCASFSFCLYRLQNLQQNNKQTVHQLAKQVGITHLDSNICADEDSLTSITQIHRKDQHAFIPYSTKRLSWHTDGYYNKPEHQINAMLLHCETPAKKGGESFLLDHELAYILLRDENPDYIKAFMQPDTMTIPANILNGKVIREAQTGPVFSINQHGQLHMRYTARQRNIAWKNNQLTTEANQLLTQYLENENSPFIIKHTLQAGEGLICRNILHKRNHFMDDINPEKKRLLYRGRYYDYIPTFHNET